MPRSLLDAVDLPQLGRAVVGEPAERLLRLLLVAGAVQHDPGEPDWADRDRIVLAGTDLQAAGTAAFTSVGYPPGQGFLVVDEAAGLGTALGLALGSRLDGGVFRVWCLLPARALDRGETWEALLAACQHRLELLTVFFLGAAGPGWPLAEVLAGAGWSVAAPGDEPLELLAALDHLLAGVRPGAVLLAAGAGAGS